MLVLALIGCSPSEHFQLEEVGLVDYMESLHATENSPIESGIDEEVEPPADASVEPCGGEIWMGDLELTSPTYEETEAFCQTFSSVAGNLRITDAQGNLTLSCLCSVDGTLEVVSSPLLRHLDLGRLERARSARIAHADQLEELELPERAELDGLSVVDAPRLVRIELPLITTLDDGLRLEGSGVEILRLPGLVEIGTLHVEDAPRLLELEAPDLLSAAMVEVDDAPWMARVSLPALSDVGSMRFAHAGLVRIAAPELTTVVSDLRFAGLADLVAVDLDSLEVVGANLSFDELPALAELALPSLQGVRGELVVAGLGEASGVSLGVLESVGGSVVLLHGGRSSYLVAPALRSIGGTLEIAENAELALLGLRALQVVEGDLILTRNPRLTGEAELVGRLGANGIGGLLVVE